MFEIEVSTPRKSDTELNELYPMFKKGMIGAKKPKVHGQSQDPCGVGMYDFKAYEKKLEDLKSIDLL